MDGRPTWTDCDGAGDYIVPNVLSPRDLVFRPDNMDETVPHMYLKAFIKNLVQIGKVVSEKIWFELLYVHDLGPRSRNDLDLQYSHTFIYSIR